MHYVCNGSKSRTNSLRLTVGSSRLFLTNRPLKPSVPYKNDHLSSTIYIILNKGFPEPLPIVNRRQSLQEPRTYDLAEVVVHSYFRFLSGQTLFLFVSLCLANS
jgi:hypothetical protein